MRKNDIAKIQNLADRYARRDKKLGMDIETLLRYAVSMGGLLIGGRERKTEHRPVPIHEHVYHNLVTNTWGNCVTPDIIEAANAQLRRQHRVASVGDDCGRLTLVRAGGVPRTAIITGLFGSYNDSAERINFCRPLTGVTRDNFGWGINPTETTRLQALGELLPEEEGAVTVHARPELINRALDVADPITGIVHIVPGNYDSVRIGHEIGQRLMYETLPTLAVVQVTGYRDLPHTTNDMLPSNYRFSKTSAT